MKKVRELAVDAVVHHDDLDEDYTVVTAGTAEEMRFKASWSDDPVTAEEVARHENKSTEEFLDLEVPEPEARSCCGR